MASKFEILCLVPDLPDPEDLLPYLQEMHANRWYTNFGPLNARFETAMVQFLTADEPVNVTAATFSSATTGLELILKAMQLDKASRVAIPNLTFPATALAVINAGLEPVLCDVDPTSWELTPELAANAHAGEPVAAVIPVAAFGKPIDIEPWLKFQRGTGVPVVIDAAASLGQQSISPELITVFSLHATKPFGVGEGGLVIGGNSDLLQQAKSLSNFGFMRPTGLVKNIGTNAKFGEYYAAVGLAQLNRWPEVFARRRTVFEMYQKYLAPLSGAIALQQGTQQFIPAVLPVCVEGKACEINVAMMNAGIQVRRWYTPLLGSHPALAHISFAPMGVEAEFKNCKKLETSLIGLPFHGFLNEQEIARVCMVLAKTL